eukprot:10189300-Alexandrium_andersonii.AAC.1
MSAPVGQLAQAPLVHLEGPRAQRLRLQPAETDGRRPGGNQAPPPMSRLGRGLRLGTGLLRLPALGRQ